MYYILYEGLKIESNEPVYCTGLSVFIIFDNDNHKIKVFNKIKKHNYNIDNQNNIFNFKNNLGHL